MTGTDDKTIMENADGELKYPQGHSIIHICLIAGAAVFFIITAVFNGLATAAVPGVFLNNTGNLADIYYVELTPDGWVFSVTWTMIYVWQAFFLVYSVSTIFRRACGYGPDPPYIYRSPIGVPIWVYPIYMLNMLLNLTWLLIWDRQHIWPGLVVIVAVQVTLYIMLFFIIRSYQCTGCNNRCEGIMRVIFVHNAIAIYAAWLTIAPLVNFAACLSYGIANPLSQRDASLVMISLLLVAVLVWFPIELTILRFKFGGTNMHYFPIFFASLGLITKHQDMSNPTMCIGIALLVIIVIFYFIKSVAPCVLHCIKSEKGCDDGCKAGGSGSVTPEQEKTPIPEA